MKDQNFSDILPPNFGLGFVSPHKRGGNKLFQRESSYFQNPEPNPNQTEWLDRRSSSPIIPANNSKLLRNSGGFLVQSTSFHLVQSTKCGGGPPNCLSLPTASHKGVPPQGGYPQRTCICIDIHLECVWFLELGSFVAVCAKVLSS